MIDPNDLEGTRATLLAELKLCVPKWDETNAVLLRMVAARLMKESGVTREFALSSGADLNRLIKQAIEFGYALREHDQRNGVVRVVKQKMTGVN